MRPSQMGRLTRDDFQLDEPIPFIAVPRGKGGRLAAEEGSKRLVVPAGRQHQESNKPFVSND